MREQYLYQILRGDGFASPALARRLNALDPRLALNELRPDDWMIIWPELVDTIKNQVPMPGHQAQAAIKKIADEADYA